MKVLVLAENAQTQRELAAGARTLGDEVIVAKIGGVPETGIADTAYAIELPEGQIPEMAADTVAALVDEVKPDMVIVEPTARLKVIGAAVAAKNDTALVNDVTAFGEGGEAESLYFGGLATIKRQPASAIKFYSCDGAAFANAEASGTDTVVDYAFVAPAHPVRLRERRELTHEGADLGRAAVVVGVGRGFGKEEDLELARELARAVHGEIACSRPLAENEQWLPKSSYLGVSGRMIAPKVYFAVGISGQMQHMIGVHNADTIIAINKDKNAPVFNQADYGLVADLHEALPALAAKLA
ncbi:electron transfer flavoprotein subunit alpha/FixB family protein [Enterorhabdus mucosicola]|uniref:Electron transfer flavoprotein subunit alpha/FixB family protein n=1 Tax=Adlercreutzia mucosicola TaxID=580026 RepID=A0A6N8JNU8_9ACTN|nr:electron transfer flavoprotein subunit alpha/FixB family protein [Adlercreutzia mucosicola]